MSILLTMLFVIFATMLIFFDKILTSYFSSKEKDDLDKIINCIHSNRRP